MQPVLILNCAILTARGNYSYQSISVKDAKVLVDTKGFVSAVGHEATAKILSEILETEIPQNRIQAKQQIGQDALVFSMNQRIPEGKILSREEIETIGYSLNLLRMLWYSL
ncbi:MAG TPA: DUF1874 domain-containing protein [Bacteroidales bacterium]|nr:DUF1874 domain-containing protein [Petrotogaceae bacterium]HQJ20861.1 DUF1874 domain-containing protein [Bacteroidales bacterium]